MIRIVNSLGKRREKSPVSKFMLVRGAKLFKKDLILFLYMSHLLKGGNVGQNMKKNQFPAPPPHGTQCVCKLPLVLRWKFAPEHHCLS